MSEQPRSANIAGVLLEFIRFGIVGGSGVVVNLVVTYLMTQLNGGVSNDNRILIPLPAGFAFRFTVLVWIVAFLIANLWNFQLNRSWTFKREQKRGWWIEFWPFFLVGLVAALVGIMLKIAFTNPTSPVYLPGPLFNDSEGLRARAYWAQLFTIILTMPVNYIVNKMWTFRRIKQADAASQPEVG